LRAIDGYEGSLIVRAALQLLSLVFVRPGELRHAAWAEFDFEQARWMIPGHRMKMKAPHIVPLSRQAITILRNLQPMTGDGVYLFPSNRSVTRPISENTLNAALRRLGYGTDDMTSHGFRSMASTRLNEMGRWNPDAIERQLAHGERNAVRAAYNHAHYLKERIELMQVWADYLDALRAGREARLLPANVTYASNAII
jgi:integrase